MRLELHVCGEDAEAILSRLIKAERDYAPGQRYAKRCYSLASNCQLATHLLHLSFTRQVPVGLGCIQYIGPGRQRCCQMAGMLLGATRRAS